LPRIGLVDLANKMKTILIIDDDKKGIIPLAVRLRAAGYQVLMAHDGVAGLNLAVHHRPDLVIMDIWMPQDNGILTAQRFKHVGLADVPLIFVTAGTRDSIWPFAEEVEPAGFFEKPFDSKQLLETITLLLDHSCPSVMARGGDSARLAP